MPRAVSVAVESPLLQLDRDFHFLVPDGLEPRFGQRVRFPFGRGKKELTGFVLEVLESSEYASSTISAIVDPRPVLTPEIYKFARAVADRQVVAIGEILALAVPDHMPRVKLEDSDLSLLLCRENIDHSVNRLCRRAGVEGSKNKVTCFGRRHGKLNRFEITHLSY